MMSSLHDHMILVNFINHVNKSYAYQVRKGESFRYDSSVQVSKISHDIFVMPKKRVWVSVMLIPMWQCRKQRIKCKA